MKRFLIPLLLVICSIGLKAQQKASASTIIEKLSAFNKIQAIEKLYVAFDKHYYFVGDTIWFKTYLLDANYGANAKSTKVYVELVNDSSNVIERLVVPLTSGIGWGDFTLKNNIEQGSYTIRAYTNLQQNFGEDLFFTKRFTIGKLDDKSWLLTSAQKISKTANDKNIDLVVKLSNLKNEAIGLKDVSVNLISDKKSLFQTNLQSTTAGLLNLSFKVPEDKIGVSSYLFIQDKMDKNIKITLPLNLTEHTSIDLQFMPEGGNLLAGYYGKIAFKAIGDDGLGVDINGKILDSKKNEIVSFKAQHKGMGSFFLLPQPNETYSALVNLPNGKQQFFPLPLAHKSGTNLRIDNTSNPDSIYIYVKASKDKWVDDIYPLLIQNGNITVYAVNINLKNGFFNAKLSKKDFPDGITHFTLFAPDQTPLNERIIFSAAQEKAIVKIEPNRSAYQTLDSIAVLFKLEDDKNQPITAGSYSVAVTDDMQLNPLHKNGNINSYYLLNSNLKGHIEDPTFYFENQNKETKEALDFLVLTQGWIGYNWKSIFSTIQQPLKFKAETGNEIIGQLTNLFKKPVPNMKVNLLSFGKNMFYSDTTSNAAGYFTFRNLPPLDSASYVIKVKTQKGKSSGATIKVDEFMPTNQLLVYKNPLDPWYFNPDSTLLNYAKETEKTQKYLLKFRPKGQMLKEVEIKGKQYLKDKDNEGWAAKLRHQIDETALKKVPRVHLIDLLYERIPGFGINSGKYSIGNPKTGIVVNVIIDNMSTKLLGEDFQQSNEMIFNYLKAEDIKDIKVYRDIAGTFIAIITRSGAGPFVQRSSGVYVYKPLPIYIPRTFYSPKYAVKPTNEVIDARATLFWEPNLRANENGEASLYFYAGAKPSTYTLTLEGTDLNGRFIFQQKKINVLPKKVNP